MNALPVNAESILRARLKGKKPAEMIRVSLVGQLGEGNHAVYANPGLPYDWRWVRDLDVCVYIGAEPTWAGTLKDIALQRPACLSLWNTVAHWGARVYLIPTADDIEQCRAVPKWEYELDVLEWLTTSNQEFLKCN